MSATAKYLVRRAIFVLAALVCATVIMFAIARMGEATPTFLIRGACGCQPNVELVRASRAELARPSAVQYLDWGWDLVRGEFGRTASFLAERLVADIILETGWNTVKLILSGWFFAIIVGVPLGVLSAVSRAGIWRFIGGIVSMFGLAMPAFLVGIALIWIFAATWEILPPAFEYGGSSIKNLVLPTIAVGLGAAAGYFRAARAAALETVNSDFIRLARDKGAGKSAAARRFALKKALIPPLVASSLLTATLINGAVAAEVVFAWPGLARMAFKEALGASFNNPYNLLFASVFIFTAIYLIMNFAADTLRAWADPRIRYS